MTQQRKPDPFGERLMRQRAQDPQGKPPPHDADCESAVIGDLLDQTKGAEAFATIRDLVSEEDFFVPLHRVFFRGITALREVFEDRPIGHVELHAWLGLDFETGDKRLLTEEELDALKSAVKLKTLFDAFADAAVTSVRVEQRARRIRSLAEMRRMVEKLWSTAAVGYAGELETFRVALQELAVQATDFGGDQTTEMELVIEPTRRIFQRYLSGTADPGIVTTGFPDLDSRLSLDAGSLVVIGARSSRGKSVLSMQMAAHVGTRYGHALYFTTEMKPEEFGLRLACAEARVDSNRVRRAACSEAEFARLTDAANGVRSCMTWITQPTDVDVLRICGIARREKRRIERQTGRKVKLVVADYLQRIAAGRAAAYQATREQQVAAIARTFKNLAQELDVCVLLPAQLNQDGDDRNDGRPRTGDLRESRGIEHEADEIILIHNPYYLARVEDPDHNMAEPEACEIIKGKGRNSGAGLAYLWFTPMFTRFDSMTREDVERERAKREQKGPGPRRAA